MAIVWVDLSVVLALHEEHLAEHGGGVGVRDDGLLQSALARPLNRAHNNTAPDIPELAAAYGFGLIRNHPFLDGNKRTAFTVTELFLALNGYELIAADADCILAMLQLAEGSLTEQAFAHWLREHVRLGHGQQQVP